MDVAVVGLGLMGWPIARRRVAAGHGLTVHNRPPERADELVRDCVARGMGELDFIALVARLELEAGLAGAAPAAS